MAIYPGNETERDPDAGFSVKDWDGGVWMRRKRDRGGARRGLWGGGGGRVGRPRRGPPSGARLPREPPEPQRKPLGAQVSRPRGSGVRRLPGAPWGSQSGTRCHPEFTAEADRPAGPALPPVPVTPGFPGPRGRAEPQGQPEAQDAWAQATVTSGRLRAANGVPRRPDPGPGLFLGRSRCPAPRCRRPARFHGPEPPDL